MLKIGSPTLALAATLAFAGSGFAMDGGCDGAATASQQLVETPGGQSTPTPKTTMPPAKPGSSSG